MASVAQSLRISRGMEMAEVQVPAQRHLKYGLEGPILQHRIIFCEWKCCQNQLAQEYFCE